MSTPFDTITTYLNLVQNFNIDPAAYAQVLHPEVEHTEYANSLYRTTQHRKFEDIMDSLRLGREMLSDTSFEVHHTFSSSNGAVVVEGRWQATAVSDIKSLTRGQKIMAQICMVFEFKDGLIYRQRRYPCYEQM